MSSAAMQCNTETENQMIKMRTDTTETKATVTVTTTINLYIKLSTVSERGSERCILLIFAVLTQTECILM